MLIIIDIYSVSKQTFDEFLSGLGGFWFRRFGDFIFSFPILNIDVYIGNNTLSMLLWKLYSIPL